MKKEFIPCGLKQVPDELLFAAAKEAAVENPANAPRMESDPQRIGLISQKYWGAKAMDLPTAFLETVQPALAQRILSHLNAWHTEADCNKKFVLTSQPGGALVRITLAGQGYWSYLGTDVKMIPATKPTMCLQQFTTRTPESEYRRVVRHEAGHTLGFPHEHTRRDIVSMLDEQKTIAYFMRTQGWSEQQVRNQVLTPIEESSLMDPTRADGLSIMTYGFPASITKDGKPIPGGADMDDLDKAYAARVYPPAVPVAEYGKIAKVIFLDAEDREIGRFER